MTKEQTQETKVLNILKKVETEEAKNEKEVKDPHWGSTI